MLHIAQMAKPQNTDRNSYRQCANCTKDNGIFFLIRSQLLANAGHIRRHEEDRASTERETCQNWISPSLKQLHLTGLD